MFDLGCFSDIIYRTKELLSYFFQFSTEKLPRFNYQCYAKFLSEKPQLFKNDGPGTFLGFMGVAELGHSQFVSLGVDQ